MSLRTQYQDYNQEPFSWMYREEVRRLMSRAAMVAAVAFAQAVILPGSAWAQGRGLALNVVSSRPEFVTGGDVLVRVDVPAGTATGGVRVSLNGTDVTARLRADAAGRSLTGLIDGLTLGPNQMVATSGSASARLSLVNHPITGPVLSSPQEQPFVCQTESFKLQSGMTLGTAKDSNCSIETRVDYYYRSTAGGALKPYPGTTPSDLADVTTLTGSKVPYIVRIQTGTINRGIYQIAMLHDDPTGPAPDAWTPSTGWNRRLIYTHGGGCVTGWYRQGANTGGVVDDVMLRQGYAVASSSLNVFGNNCNDLLTTETMMMVKERFIEAYGAPKFTIGWGCSGGSYQQLQNADNYPGLLDGIIPCRTFPDVGFATVMTISDARLLNRYFMRAGTSFTEEQQRAVAGFLTIATMKSIDEDAGRIHVSEFCPEVLPSAVRYDPAANPRGARCDVYDHAVTVYGRDPKTGFARRPLDNVGIQYGLRALNAGTISKEQFLDLNERIGGFDNDGNVVASRSVADIAAVRAAYRTGRLTNTGGGLASTPIIDYRNYLDDAPMGDIHVRFHSFSLRERLIKANGYADNHVILIEDNRYRANLGTSPVYQLALAQMEQWLTALTGDTSDDAAIVKVRRAKPPELADACWTRDGTPQKVAEQQTRNPSSRCEQLYPSASFPREIAGGPVANDIAKCQLKPIGASDYKVAFTAAEMARLRRVFPEGVCDWTRPGVEQQRLTGTWQVFRAGAAGTQ
ncbi:MAG: DUF6351 family protein [Vicinamibacterales bacterium]